MMKTMSSLVNFCFVLIIFTGYSPIRVKALWNKYIPLISDVHTYYGTSNLQELTMVNLLCREFSRAGIFTLIVNFEDLETTEMFYDKRIVRPLAVVMLKTENDITDFNENSLTSNKSHMIWLLIFVGELNEALCKYCSHPTGNIFNLRFDTEMLVVCCQNTMLTEWWSTHPNRTETVDFAKWTANGRLTLLTMKGLYSRRHETHGAGFRVAIVTKSTLVYDYGNKVGGFGGAILEELQIAMNFTITEILREIRFGSWSSSTGNWSGVVGQLAQDKADLGVAEFTMTTSRINVVDFTLPMIISRNVLYIKVPDGLGVRWNSYIEVFEFEIWMAVIILLITAPILLTVIKLKRSSVPLPCLILENYLQVWGIFCQEAISQFPAETPLRIAYVSIFVSAVVVSAAYSASLISFLTVSSVSLPFSTLEGFAADKSYKLIVIQNSSYYDFFDSSIDPVLKNMMTSMKSWKNLPQTLEEGFDQVCKEKVGFYTDEIVKNAMSQSIRCKLAEIDSGRADNLAMILSPDNQYTGIINYHIQRFQDNGVLNRLKHKYTLKGLRGHGIAQSKHSVVGIWGVVPILTVLGCGIILALIILFCETMYRIK